MKLLSTNETAVRLGLSPQRVRVLADNGRLRGQKIGTDWVFTEREVERFKQLDRPAHRPSKA